MRYVKFLIALFVLLVFWWTGGTHGAFSPRIPAIGKLMSPFDGFWRQAVPIDHSHDEPIKLQLDGGSGEVVIDERGVPHIFAPTLEDAFFLQGYWHARDRLWQMDISVRATEGRLAEILGERLLERDRLQRRKGMNVAARRARDAWQKNPEEYGWVTAYADGVNAFINSLSPEQYPLEYKMMGFAPEPWSTYRSAVFMKSMAETLCFRSRDVESSNARALLGDSLFTHLYPEYNPKQSPVIPVGTSWDYIPLAEGEENAPSDELSDLSFPFESLPQSSEEIGSNNWALAGSKTASGNPILCNDPHLRLTLPSIWYEIQIHTPEVNAYGVSLPGTPGIIIGFNEEVAWGMTNGSQDVLDWYRIQWTDDKRTSYVIDGEEREPEWAVDTIWIRGQATPHIERTPWTVWGPVVHTDPEDSRFDLSMRWLALDQPAPKTFYELGTFVGFMKAKNYDDYRAALLGYDSPIQNFAFAAQDGSIALTVNGKLPHKRDGQGRYVQEGNVTENAWLGIIPHEEVPAVKDPARGFISSANQHSTDESYPYYYNGGFDDYRGRYINRRLEGMQNATVDSMMRLQLDAHSLFAEEALPVFLDYIQADQLGETAAAMLEALSSWDYYYTAGERAPVYFEAWFDKIYELTFDELYPEPWERQLLTPERWRLLELIQQAPQDTIFENQATADRFDNAQDIVQMALQEAAVELGAEALTDPEGTWSFSRSTVIQHLGNIPGFDSGLLHMDGYRLSPNAISSRNGPSWRMIVELGDEVKAWGVFPGGASGNPGSPHYDDGLDEWVAGDYFLLSFMKNAQDVRFPTSDRWVFE